MDTQQKEGSVLSGLAKGFGIVIVLAGAVFFYVASSPENVQKEVDKINVQVALDAVEQYKIAVKGGDLIQICVQAQMVSAALLQAKDEDNYLKWKDTEKAACRKAGMPY